MENLPSQSELLSKMLEFAVVQVRESITCRDEHGTCSRLAYSLAWLISLVSRPHPLALRQCCPWLLKMVERITPQHNPWPLDHSFRKLTKLLVEAAVPIGWCVLSREWKREQSHPLSDLFALRRSSDERRDVVQFPYQAFLSPGT